MKRNILLLLILFPLLCSAKHVEFMGINLNGTITNFTTLIKRKGVTISPYNNQAPLGTRSFKGKFFSNDASIYVYYNPTTKIVYRAKACVEFSTLNQAKNFLNEIKNGLSYKYGEGYTTDGTSDGYPSFERSLVDTDVVSSDGNGGEGYLVIGAVQGYISYFQDLDEYTVHIDYWDSDNYVKHQRQNINDL